MKWARFKSRHGRGHQSTTIRYIPFTYDITEDDLQIELEHWAQQWDVAWVEAEFIDEVPQEAIKNLTDKYQSEYAIAMRVLANLRTHCEHVIPTPEDYDPNDRWFSRGAKCEKCGADLGWWCPKNPSGYCEYDYPNDGESCVHCGNPEERK